MLRIAAHVAMALLALFCLANAVVAWLLFDFGTRNEGAAEWRQPLGVALVAAGFVVGAGLLARARHRHERWGGFAATTAIAVGAGAACIPLGPL